MDQDMDQDMDDMDDMDDMEEEHDVYEQSSHSIPCLATIKEQTQSQPIMPIKFYSAVFVWHLVLLWLLQLQIWVSKL